MSDYNLVYINGGDGFYYLISVKTGDVVDIPDAEELGISNFLNWINDETGEIFDASQPITQDIRLYAQTNIIN
jgi:hypothetical protein